ncbi:MAG: GNAT family protein [Bacteroidota bacterium]
MFPQLTTDRLLLRQFQSTDLQNVFSGLSHPDVIRYYGISFDSLEATQEQLDWYANLEKERTGLWWAICSRDGSTFYGGGGFNNWQQEHRKAEVGFWLLPDHWGRGIMSEGMPLICSYAFDRMNLHRIEGFVESSNQNCKRALAKLNFVHEGTMVDCEYKDGAFISLDIYAKFPSQPSSTAE